MVVEVVGRRGIGRREIGMGREGRSVGGVEGLRREAARTSNVCMSSMSLDCDVSLDKSRASILTLVCVESRLPADLGSPPTVADRGRVEVSSPLPPSHPPLAPPQRLLSSGSDLRLDLPILLNTV